MLKVGFMAYCGCLLLAIVSCSGSAAPNGQGAPSASKPTIKVAILPQATTLPADREVVADDLAVAIQRELDLNPDLPKYKLKVAFWENKNGYVTLGVINDGNFSSAVTQALMRGDSLSEIASLVSDAPPIKVLIALEGILLKLPGLRRLAWTPLGYGMAIKDLSTVSR